MQVKTLFCANRILVQDSVMIRFLPKKLVDAVAQLKKSGNGLDDNQHNRPFNWMPNAVR